MNQFITFQIKLFLNSQNSLHTLHHNQKILQWLDACFKRKEASYILYFKDYFDIYLVNTASKYFEH